MILIFLGIFLISNSASRTVTNWSLMNVLTQIGLGGWTVLSGRAPVINTAHVATGAMVLGTALILGLRVNRHRFPDVQQVGPLRARPTEVATEPASPGAPV